MSKSLSYYFEDGDCTCKRHLTLSSSVGAEEHCFHMHLTERHPTKVQNRYDWYNHSKKQELQLKMVLINTNSKANIKTNRQKGPFIAPLHTDNGMDTWWPQLCDDNKLPLLPFQQARYTSLWHVLTNEKSYDASLYAFILIKINGWNLFKIIL